MCNLIPHTNLTDEITITCITIHVLYVVLSFMFLLKMIHPWLIYTVRPGIPVLCKSTKLENWYWLSGNGLHPIVKCFKYPHNLFSASVLNQMGTVFIFSISICIDLLARFWHPSLISMQSPQVPQRPLKQTLESGVGFFPPRPTLSHWSHAQSDFRYKWNNPFVSTIKNKWYICINTAVKECGFFKRSDRPTAALSSWVNCDYSVFLQSNEVIRELET